MKVLIQGLQCVRLETGRVRARPRLQLCDHRDAAINRRLDQHPGADHTCLVQAPADSLQGILRRNQLLEPTPAPPSAGCWHHQDAPAARLRAVTRSLSTVSASSARVRPGQGEGGIAPQYRGENRAAEEIDQGVEMGRPSHLRARVEGSPDQIEKVIVAGRAVVAKSAA